MATKTQNRAYELVREFGKTNAIRHCHAMACTVSQTKKVYWRNVKAHIEEFTTK